jgi:transcriptional regulator with XRE-family HTH domain
MQAYFSRSGYTARMSSKSRLRELRERAGISQRELARAIDQDSSNVSYWERTGKTPRSEALAPIAKALGVTVEDLLGLPPAKTKGVSGGRLGKVFDRVSQLPRRQQNKVIEMAEGFLALHDQSKGGA